MLHRLLVTDRHVRLALILSAAALVFSVAAFCIALFRRPPTARAQAQAEIEAVTEMLQEFGGGGRGGRGKGPR